MITIQPLCISEHIVVGLLPAEVTMVSVVLVSSSRIVGYVGCNRKSLLISGSAAETPGAT